MTINDVDHGWRIDPMPEEAALPEFAIAMRGYDRLQVDDYIVKQAVWLSEAESRVAAAEAELASLTAELSSLKAERASLRAQVASLEEQAFKTAPPSFEELGERIGRVLQEAWAAAEEMRRDAEETAAEITARAEERLARADEEAERRARRAEAEVEAVVSKAREEAIGEAAAVVEDAKQETTEVLARCREEADRLTGEAERRRRQLGAEIAVLTDQRAHAMAELGRLRSALEALFSASSQEAGSAGTPVATDEAIDLRGEEPTAVSGSPDGAVGSRTG
jgi:chromosome segregation ATPase